MFIVARQSPRIDANQAECNHTRSEEMRQSIHVAQTRLEYLERPETREHKQVENREHKPENGVEMSICVNCAGVVFQRYESESCQELNYEKQNLSYKDPMPDMLWKQINIYDCSA